MDIRRILTHVDHTLLSPCATWAQIQTLCDEGMRYGVASACIPASYVARAKAYVDGRLPVCTVIGFPNGYDTTASKCFQAADAVRNGADEVDMVIDLGMVKDGAWDALLSQIDRVKAACDGRLLKVIVETCLLTETEKVRLCRLVSDSSADFIKTSTGFSTGGATFEDVALMKAHVSPRLKIKAAGGIASLEDAQRFLTLGADRLGTSRIVRLVRQLEAEGSFAL